MKHENVLGMDVFSFDVPLCRSLTDVQQRLIETKVNEGDYGMSVKIQIIEDQCIATFVDSSVVGPTPERLILVGMIMGLVCGLKL